MTKPILSGAIGATVLGLLYAFAVATGALACEGWDKVFELSTEEAHLVSVLAGPNSAWIAGGIGVVAAGDGHSHNQQVLAGSAIEAFGIAPDGGIYAVGSHGAIWKRAGTNAWHEEHRSRRAGSKGTRKFRDLLVGVRAVPYQSRIVMLAYGPGGSPSLLRDEQGSWTPPPPEVEKELVALAVSGPPMDLPSDCRRDRWRWIGDQNGVAFCNDGRAFALLNGKVVATGKTPKACEFVTDVVWRGSELFACCGRDGRIFRFAEGDWTPVPQIKDIFALAANERCLVAASDRAVWQQCLPAKTTVDADVPAQNRSQARDGGAGRSPK